ncbi:MAG TPA: hypothetical protein VMB51_09170 [Solirubrobacteraceae bacterium]|nr:hypothetical protein [Solirubrobacteraceae bacterium]
MAERAGVSRDVFGEVFAGTEGCYRTVHAVGAERLSRAVEQAAAGRESWAERVRACVVGLLGFMDDEPGWGRLLVAEPPFASVVAPECQQRVLAVLTGLLDEAPVGVQSEPAQSAQSLGLKAELVAGGVFSVIRTRVLAGDGEAFVELAPALLSFIAAQYGIPTLVGETSASPSPGESLATSGSSLRATEISRAAELPIRATHRTTLVLHAIARAPYSNNREVAHAAGLADEGQASKLLARLERRGLIENVGVGAARGEPNAWLLTPAGQRAVELLGEGRTGEVARPRVNRARGIA